MEDGAADINRECELEAGPELDGCCVEDGVREVGVVDEMVARSSKSRVLCVETSSLISRSGSELPDGSSVWAKAKLEDDTRKVK